MLLESYVREDKVTEVLNNFFTLFPKFLVLASLPHTQTQMILPED